MKLAKLVKEDFEITKGTDGGVYITPKIGNSKRNDRLDSKTKMTQRHSYNGDISYYSNNGMLSLNSNYFSYEDLLEKAIAYYNWN